METPARAAVYVRVSSKGQEQDGSSLETQEAACIAHARERGYSVDPQHVYREVHTGVELWERPELTRLREAARAHAFDVVIAYAIDRLARDPVHLGVVLSEADHHGVAVEFITEPLDDSPEGQLIRFVRGYAARVEHEKIRERTLRGKLARARAGKLAGGRVLYGYQWADPEPHGKTRYFLDATSRVVYRIFDEAINQRRTLAQIGAGLDADGILTPMGKKHWSRQTVANVLRQPAYCGRPANLRWRSEKVNGTNKRRLSPRPESEWVPLAPDVVPAIVPEAWFDAAQVVLAHNKAQAARNNKHPEDYLLRAGHAVCATCGAPLYTTKKNGKPAYYCANALRQTGLCSAGVSIAAHILDSSAWDKLSRLLSDPLIVEQELRRMEAEDEGGERVAADLAAVDRAVGQIERKRRNLTRELEDIDDDDTAAPVRERLEALTAQLKTLQAEREGIAERERNWKAAREQLHSIAEWSKTKASELSTMGYAEKRCVLEQLQVKAVVYQADHAPRFELEVTFTLNKKTGYIETTSRS